MFFVVFDIAKVEMGKEQKLEKRDILYRFLKRPSIVLKKISDGSKNDRRSFQKSSPIVSKTIGDDLSERYR